MAAALAPDDDDDLSLTRLTRTRGMTEGIDEHTLQNLNANTHDMIKSNINQIQKMESVKKSQMKSDSQEISFFMPSAEQTNPLDKVVMNLKHFGMEKSSSLISEDNDDEEAALMAEMKERKTLTLLRRA